MSDRIAVMSQGLVQQVGSAREIYEAPINRFVAEFIGETNLIDVEVTRVSAGTADLVLPSGQKLSCSSAASATGRHALSIRPERVTVAADGELTATVERVVYMGSDLKLLTRLDGGKEFTVRVQNAARTAVPEPGARIGLKLEEGAARLLAD
jgi:spermidine/putrescine transport system ATP-binding protein